MRVLCCGDRHWESFEIIERELKKLDKDTIIIQGCADGADKKCRYIARILYLKLLSSKDNHDVLNNPGFPANWKRYGRAAGLIRNIQMLDEGNPDLVLAFHTNIENSKGTKNMIEQAKKRGIKVVLIKE